MFRMVLSQQRAFSLVELSIVLVILGLLTGGILAGKSLIRASELRSVGTDLARYQAAALTFRDKYFGLPGDLINATSIWGAAANCVAQTDTGTLTCNGNGDGLIQWSLPTMDRSEMFLFWQHLSNAGLIEGKYSGVRGTGTLAGSSTVGGNSPASRISNGCYSVATWVNLSGLLLSPADSLNVFTFGKVYGSGTANPDYCDDMILTPEEAWNIDSKSDDGIPGTGGIQTWNSIRNSGCTTSDTASTSRYKLDNTATTCSLVVKMK